MLHKTHEAYDHNFWQLPLWTVISTCKIVLSRFSFGVYHIQCSFQGAQQPSDHLRSGISFSRTCNIPNLTSYVYYIALLPLKTLHWLYLHSCAIACAPKQTFAQCKILLEWTLITFIRRRSRSGCVFSCKASTYLRRSSSQKWCFSRCEDEVIRASAPYQGCVF